MARVNPHKEFRSLSSVKEEHFNNEAAKAIIEDSSSHLITQEQLFEAEGGNAGLLTQLAFSAAAFGGLAVAKPQVFKYLLNGQMKKNEWFWLGSTFLFSHHIGTEMGVSWFGDSEKRDNHWMAYYYQKAVNRQEGRRVLMKKPKLY